MQSNFKSKFCIIDAVYDKEKVRIYTIRSYGPLNWHNYIININNIIIMSSNIIFIQMALFLIIWAK
jgi:hypothetical protein